MDLMAVDVSCELIGVEPTGALSANTVACSIGIIPSGTGGACSHAILFIGISLFTIFTEAFGVKGPKHAWRTSGIADSISFL
jgi:glycerol-3-phosphate dehydrogenase